MASIQVKIHYNEYVIHYKLYKRTSHLVCPMCLEEGRGRT